MSDMLRKTMSAKIVKQQSHIQQNRVGGMLEVLPCTIGRNMFTTYVTQWLLRESQEDCEPLRHQNCLQIWQHTSQTTVRDPSHKNPSFPRNSIQGVPDLRTSDVRTSALTNRRPTCTDPDPRTVVHATNMGIATGSPGFEYWTNDLQTEIWKATRS
jgi:hypothetical protein